MIDSTPPVSGDGSVSRYLLTPTTICSPRSIASSRAVFDFDQLLLHVARFDRGHRAAHFVDALELFQRLAFERVHLAGDFFGAVENVAIVEQVGFVGEDLLHAQRPLLVPGPRQAERLVPRRQLHGARARILRQRHRQHFDENARDVVFRLRLGEAERVHLHAVAEQPLLGVGDAVAGARDLLPQFGEGAHLAHLGDEAHAGVDEEGNAPDHLAEFFLGRPRRNSSPYRARRRQWRAQRQAPAPASLPPPADGRSRCSSDSTSAARWW